MFNASIISPDKFISMPWRNGTGTTVELIKRDLPNIQGAEFAWRLSKASVNEDGLFSNFAHYDRTLVLLEGQGITLDHGSNQCANLSMPLQMAKFKGESHTTGLLHNGPIIDFNIMTRRGVCYAETSCYVDSPPLEITTSAETLMIYCVAGEIDINIASHETLSLHCDSLLLIEPAASTTVGFDGQRFIVVEIFDTGDLR